MNKNYFLVAITVFSSVIISCSKDRIEEETANFTSMDSFYNEHKVEEQEFVINDTTGGPIIGNQGTELRSLGVVYPNGDSVALPFSVYLTELYQYDDMIFYGFPSTSNQQVMQTGGEIKVRAAKDGNDLVLASGHSYNATLYPYWDIATSGMAVYYGDTPGDVFNDWDLASDGSSITLDTVPRYVMSVKEFGWANCAMPKTASVTDIDFNLPEAANGSEFIDIYICLKDYQGMIKGGNLNAVNVPVGVEATVVALAMEDGVMVYHKEAITVSEGMSITLDLQEISETDLLAELDQL